MKNKLYKNRSYDAVDWTNGTSLFPVILYVRKKGAKKQKQIILKKNTIDLMFFKLCFHNLMCLCPSKILYLFE